MILHTLNYTTLDLSSQSLDLDNFKIIGKFRVVGNSSNISGHPVEGFSIPFLFENYDSFQIIHYPERYYFRIKDNANNWLPWQRHKHKIADIDGLQSVLDSHSNSISSIQSTLNSLDARVSALEFDNFSYLTYSKMKVGNSSPTSPNHSDLFYNRTNNTLWRYDAISSNWIPIDWQTIIKASPEYQANRLRVNSITGKLEISPNGTTWYECIPAVGNKVIELMTFDSSNFSYKYWIAPGQIVIIRNANHIPIVYAKDIEPFFDGAYWHSYSYEIWVGIRPSNISISNGDGQLIQAEAQTLFADRSTNLSIVPIHQQANTSENWANFVLRIRNNQRFLNNSIGLGSQTYAIHATNCSGTASSMSYWLGTWYTQQGSNFQVNVLTLTRRA
jgi:hypothetical protein